MGLCVVLLWCGVGGWCVVSGDGVVRVVFGFGRDWFVRVVGLWLGFMCVLCVCVLVF